mgnify:CR=1 FL=1
MINAIVAVDERLGIGQNNDMPWPRNKADMKWFRSNTSGGTVIMGRRTWESIGEKNLPNRINVVVTNSDISDDIPRSGSMEQKIRPHWIVEGDVKTILEDFENMYSDRPVWVIGGANIFRQALPFVQKLYITTIPGKYNCDVFLDKKQIDSFNVVEYNQVIDDTIFEIRTK